MIIPYAKPGYEIPDTYCENYDNNGSLEKLNEGFRVEDDTEFPSVFKLEVGKNILVNGNGAPVSFFTQYDPIRISACHGYALPDKEKFDGRFENLLTEGENFRLTGDE